MLRRVLSTYMPLALLPLAAGAAALGGFAEIPLTGLDAGDLMARFLGLVLIALVVERAVEIFMVLRFGPRADRGPGDAPLRPHRARAAQLVSCALGLCVAVVGLRVLGQLLPGGHALTAAQLVSFRIVDVVVTTLVLAGGAEGMHRIARRLGALK